MSPNDPLLFDAFVDGNPVGSTVAGHVVEIQQYGAFCELASGVIGLLLVVDFEDSPRRYNYPDDYPKVGDLVVLSIKFVNRDQRKIGLTRRANLN